LKEYFSKKGSGAAGTTMRIDEILAVLRSVANNGADYFYKETAVVLDIVATVWNLNNFF